MIYLLDSNIAIYFLKKNIKVLTYLEKLDATIFCLSIITWIEVMVGIKDKEEKIIAENFFRKCRILSLNMDIAIKIVDYLQNNNQNLRMPSSQDMIIAFTAINEEIPLITANYKHFKKFKDLKIISIK